MLTATPVSYRLLLFISLLFSPLIIIVVNKRRRKKKVDPYSPISLSLSLLFFYPLLPKQASRQRVAGTLSPVCTKWPTAPSAALLQAQTSPQSPPLSAPPEPPPPPRAVLLFPLPPVPVLPPPVPLAVVPAEAEAEAVVVPRPPSLHLPLVTAPAAVLLVDWSLRMLKSWAPLLLLLLPWPLACKNGSLLPQIHFFYFEAIGNLR